MVDDLAGRANPELIFLKGLYLYKLVLLLAKADQVQPLDNLHNSLLHLYSRTDNTLLCLHLAEYHSSPKQLHWLVPMLPTIRPDSLQPHPALPATPVSLLVLNLTYRILRALLARKETQVLTQYLSKGLCHLQTEPYRHLPTRIVSYYSRLQRSHPGELTLIQEHVIKLLRTLEGQRG